jgi:hypothetical protein
MNYDFFCEIIMNYELQIMNYFVPLPIQTKEQYELRRTVGFQEPG